MKTIRLCLTLALVLASVPGAAQTSSTQVNSNGNQELTQSSTLKLFQAGRSAHHPDRTPQEKAHEEAVMAKTNDLNRAGQEALHNKNFVVAEANYQELIQMGTLSFYSYYGLGEALAGEGKTADALTAYKTAVYWPLNTGPEGVAFSQAIGNPSNLRGCCGPTDSIAWMKYALLLTQTGQEAEARVLYKEASRYVPERLHPEATLTAADGTPVSTAEFQSAIHVALGLLGGGRNDSEENMTEFTQALRLAPDAAAANYYYGYGWKRLDLQSKTRLADATQAKAALQKAALADDENVKKAAGEALNGLR